MNSARSARPGGAVERRQYAGLVTRLLALTVDATVLALAGLAISAGLPALWGSLTGSAPDWLRACARALAAFLPFAYFWLSWCTSGHTIGGALLGVAVRRTNGSRLGAAVSAARALFGLLLAPVWLAAMVLIAFDPRRRALHDILFRTVVRRVGA